MKFKLLTTILLSIFLINLVSAAYYIPHEYYTIKGFDEVDSPITTTCRDRLDIVLDGVEAADIFVIHYTDKDKVGSYISTHNKFAGYQKCLEDAGNDLDLKCFCYGIGLHPTQDNFFHNEDGLVVKYIKKYLTNNLIGHMAIENDHEKKTLNLIENDLIVTSGRLEYYDSTVLNNLFEETGGDIKYMNLLSEMSGLSLSEVKRDANIIANGYKGSGFYDTVYKEKVSLPAFFWWISIGLIVIGLLITLGLIFIPLALGIKTTRWKYLFILLTLLITIIGVLLIISIYTGSTWSWVNLSLRILPIRVTEADASYYNQQAQIATNEFLRTGKLAYDDASGLSYRGSDGVWREGALNRAESGFKILLILFIIPYLVLLSVFLIYKTFAINKKGGLNKFMNVIGWILLSILIVLIIGDIVLILLS